MSDEPRDPASGPGADGDPVGSVAEEAAKLFGALSDWARDATPEGGPDLRGAAEGLAGRAAAAAREVSEHVDTGAAECAWCPVCRTVHLVRATSPEVRDHLASAAASLMQAASGILAAAGTPRERHQPAVEHIDLDADDDAAWPQQEET